jgi:hypothetical protein
MGEKNLFGEVVQREVLDGRWVEFAATSKYYYSRAAPLLWPSIFESLPTSRVWEYNSAESLAKLTRHMDGEGIAEASTKAVFEDVGAFAFMQLLKTDQLLARVSDDHGVRR